MTLTNRTRHKDFDGGTMNQDRLLSIVVPVFNETEVIPEFYKRTKKVVDSLDSYDYELIFIDDGSRDDSYQKLLSLVHRDAKVRVIKLSRNFGHQVAITAGIDVARGDAIVVIDADLQHPPELIANFLEKWEEGYDVVYGIREKREAETGLKLLTASLFYRLLRGITKIDIPPDVGDFRLLSRRVASHLRQLREKDRFVRGMVSWLGFKQTGVYYARDKRWGGVTKYPFRKMLRFAIDGITSFSSVPLRLATWLGYLSSLLAFLYACFVFVEKAIGYTVQGWATIMIGILFIGGVQLICIGIMGEYVGRIFEQTKQRPLYVIEEISDSGRVETIRSHSESVLSREGNS